MFSHTNEVFKAVRRGDKCAYNFVFNFLKEQGRYVFYKYYKYLVDLGVESESVHSLYDIYINDFIELYECKILKIVPYFRKYVTFRLGEAIKIKNSKKEQRLLSAVSYEGSISSSNESFSLSDVIADKENIRDSYNMQEILDYCMDEKNQFLDDIERRTLIAKIDGESLTEAAKKCQISYKSFLAIYYRAIDKIRTKFY